MTNYNNGKIYKIEPITDHDEEDIYIGSTTKQYLSQRMTRHRSDFKRWQEGNNKSYTTACKLFKKYGIDNCQIVLIENFFCDSKDELTSREAYFIKTFRCVNKVIPMRSLKEYREDNKERMQKQKQEYLKTNQTKIKEAKKEYRMNNDEKIKQYDAEYRRINEVKIKMYKNEKFNCECGGRYIRCAKACHLRSLKHQSYIKNLEIENI